MQTHYHFKQTSLYLATHNTINLLCISKQLAPSSSCVGAPTEKLPLFMCYQLLKITHLYLNYVFHSFVYRFTSSAVPFKISATVQNNQLEILAII